MQKYFKKNNWRIDLPTVGLVLRALTKLVMRSLNEVAETMLNHCCQKDSFHVSSHDPQPARENEY